MEEGRRRPAGMRNPLLSQSNRLCISGEFQVDCAASTHSWSSPMVKGEFECCSYLWSRFQDTKKHADIFDSRRAAPLLQILR